MRGVLYSFHDGSCGLDVEFKIVLGITLFPIPFLMV